MQICKPLSGYSFTSIHLIHRICYHYWSTFIKHPQHVESTEWWLNVKYKLKVPFLSFTFKTGLKFDIKLSIQRQIRMNWRDNIYHSTIQYQKNILILNLRYTVGKKNHETKEEKTLRWFNVFLWLSHIAWGLETA